MLGRLPSTLSLMVSLVSKESYNLLSVKIFKNLNSHRTLKSSRCLHFIFNNSSEYRYQISKLKNSIPVTSARYFDPRPESGAALGTDHTFTQRIYVSTIYTVTRYSTIYQHPVTPDNGHHGWVSRYTFFQVKWPCDFISLPGLPPPLQAKVESTPRVGMTMPWWGNSLWMSWKWLLGGELSRHRLIVDIPTTQPELEYLYCTFPGYLMLRARVSLEF